MQAIAYLRASTEDQKLTFDVQRAAIKRFLGKDPAMVFEECVSGAADLDKRPKLLEAISNLGANDSLVVAKVDRLTRSPATAGLIEHLVHKRGALLVSADGVGNGSGPQAELMRDIVVSMAKYERALIIMRTREALRAKRMKGEKTGGSRPYGYTVEDGMLLRLDTEWQWVEHMTELRDAGWSYANIAADMNDHFHIPAANGGRWHSNSVRRIIIRSRGEDDAS